MEDVKPRSTETVKVVAQVFPPGNEQRPDLKHSDAGYSLYVKPLFQVQLRKDC